MRAEIMDQATAPVVSLRHVRKVYPSAAGPRVALADITFDVARGELACVVGPTARASPRCSLLGGRQPSLGARFRGRAAAVRAAGIGVVFQDYGRSLYPWLTVAHNVDLPLRVRGVRRSARAERVAEVLASVGLTDTGRQYPWQLSGACSSDGDHPPARRRPTCY